MFVLAGVCAILVGPLHLDCSKTVSAACKSREAAGALPWQHYTHEWVGLVIEVSLLLTAFAFARSAWPSRLARLVFSGALAVLAAGIVTFVLNDSFAGYQGLVQRLWTLVGHIWVLLCATALILEATLDPHALRAREASTQPHALGERASVGVDPA
jgi:hypothetical protein